MPGINTKFFIISYSFTVIICLSTQSHYSNSSSATKLGINQIQKYTVNIYFPSVGYQV